MKHFLPSSVMLTPFVVKYYEPQEEEDQNPAHLENTNQEEQKEESD